VNRSGPLRIGTRGSQLALWQANRVADLLRARGLRVELAVIRTTGDRLQDASLSQAGGKRLFVKEIEDALLRNEVDIAVHSAKDLPATLPAGLDLAAALPREDPSDAIVLPLPAAPGSFPEIAARLGDEPVLATSSVRRKAQLMRLFAGPRFLPMRGNVDTRLRKLDAGTCEGLVLAAAGLHRLGLSDRITATIPLDACVPAPGQGIIVVEIRSDDGETRTATEALHDIGAGVSLAAERALVDSLGGGCQLPLGALALEDNGALELRAVVASPDGRELIERRGRGLPADPEGLGRRIADELARAGATVILDAVRHTQASAETADS
jgi:hydroxymethylbilane synthase